ncbi:CUB-like domain-containing protein [Caenorhabditis elegans]|uniref:CUB-like domain-containing protein n=1 Tax=Caenorhabditis elegans TaxID=6239 RepID=A5JYX7_CAEEL|nr:CUB-like domain-containing protein [Caenorhabditis elegans]CAN86613.2 CUB-like domain-containing protein [Caenorhabditis elegans]|eukprot:NP_001123002.2 Uncharacterized protein CELE_T05E12.6 [Caenorhabditis elegans]
MFHFEMKAIFLIFTIVIAFSNATIPECSGGVVTFDKPANTTIGTSYPGVFNNSNIQNFPKLYNCDYQINVPQNYSARVHLYVVTNDNTTAPVQVTDQLGRSEDLLKIHFSFLSHPVARYNSRLEIGKLVLDL